MLAGVFPVARAAQRLPGGLGRLLFDLAADLAWVTRRGGVTVLERNLTRMRPDLSRREIRRLSRSNLRRYLANFYEAVELPGLTPAQIEARVRMVGDREPARDCREGRGFVAALGHCGNWDLAGAHATTSLAPVLTVAEVLEPSEVFEEFLAMRRRIGLEILPMQAGVFRELLRRVRSTTHATPLLADRDLSSSGVEVQLAGRRARVAAGPAALALGGKLPLYPAMIRRERLTGPRRRRAGSPWGIVIELLPAVWRPDDDAPANGVAELTQRWVGALAERIRLYPGDWHMLQRVFVEDLDAARLHAASATSGAATDAAVCAEEG